LIILELSRVSAFTLIDLLFGVLLLSMEDVDPHMLFDFGRESLLDELQYWPGRVDVIEIYQFEVG
jgi:hypothetical protein